MLVCANTSGSLLSLVSRPMSPWTEARLHSRPTTWSSTDSTGSPRRPRRVPPSPGVVEVRSVDRAETLVRQPSNSQAAAAASRTAPGSLETVSPRRPASPPLPQNVVEPRPHGAESSPANSRRERYGIATIMARTTPTVAPTVVAPPPDAAPGRAGADNSFDSVPTDYDVSDTSRSRSGEPVTTTSMDSSSSATGAATAGSGGGGSLDTDSTDKSTGTAGSHKLHQMRDDSGYKSLETQQSLGKTGVGGTLSASVLARIGTRSFDRAAPWPASQPAAVVVGRAQYSLEAPSVPAAAKFAAAVGTSELLDIVVPVPQLAVHDVKTSSAYLDEPAIPKKTPSHSALSDFFAGRSFGCSPLLPARLIVT